MSRTWKVYISSSVQFFRIFHVSSVYERLKVSSVHLKSLFRPNVHPGRADVYPVPDYDLSDGEFSEYETTGPACKPSDGWVKQVCVADWPHSDFCLYTPVTRFLHLVLGYESCTLCNLLRNEWFLI